MNYLRKRGEDFPFEFFVEEAFYTEQVVGYIVDAYYQITEFKNEIIRPQGISHRDLFTFTLGKIARIVHLGEDHIDLFFRRQDNDYIRELADECNGDLIKTTEKFQEMGSWITIGNEMGELFEKDIKAVFDMEYMFYLDSSIPYDSLWFFRRDGEMAPFAEDNIKRLFKNVPIVSVW